MMDAAAARGLRIVLLVALLALGTPCFANGTDSCWPGTTNSVTLTAVPGDQYSSTAGVSISLTCLWSHPDTVSIWIDVPWLLVPGPVPNGSEVEISADLTGLGNGAYVGHIYVPGAGVTPPDPAVCTVTLWIAGFRDVPLGNWAFEEVNSCQLAGFTRGLTDGSYAPDLPLTRDQMAVYVARALALGDEHVPTGPAQASFRDVPTEHWAFRYIEYAKSRGIVAGYPDQLYRPSDDVDRAQIAVTMARLMAGGDTSVPHPECSEAVFPDVPCDFWASKYIRYARDNGIARGYGYPDYGYHPDEVCTRDQMAVFLYRATRPIAEVDLQHSNLADLDLFVGVGPPNEPHWRKQVLPASDTVFDGSGTLRFDLAASAVDWAQSLPHLLGAEDGPAFVEAHDAVGGDVSSLDGFRLHASGNTWAATETPISINEYERAYLFAPTFVDPMLWVRRQPGYPVGRDTLFVGSPAVGDLDGDGDLELVAMGAASVYAWDVAGEVLPGWPSGGGGKRASASPALADLDRDGDLEVLIATSTANDWGSGPSLYALHGDGTLVTGWPVGLPFMYDWALDSSPAVGDLDGDGSPEVVIGSRAGGVYAFRSDGTAVPGWPVGAVGAISATPAIGDLDGDQLPEVVVATLTGQAWLLEGDGSVAPGWPVDLAGSTTASPALADFDGDGQMEAAFVAGNQVAIYNGEGQIISEWTLTSSPRGSPAVAEPNGTPPPEVAPFPEVAPASASCSPVVADLDGDGELDIAIGSDQGMLFLTNWHGELIKWPIPLPGAMESAPVVADLDGDGYLELAALCTTAYPGILRYGSVYVWKMPGSAVPNALQWPMFQHDAMHTGTYITP